MYGNRIQELFTHGCLSSYQNVISAHTMPCPTIQLNTPTFDIWFWQHCDLKIFSNSVFSAHEILLAGGWPKTEILSIRLLGSDNCPHRPSIDTYHSLKPEAFQILWPVLNQAFSGGSQWWWVTTFLSTGSLAIGIHHHENAEKMWIHQMAETGTNTPLYQSSKTRAGAKNVKKCGLLGGLPKHGRLVKGDLGQKIWTWSSARRPSIGSTQLYPHPPSHHHLYLCRPFIYVALFITLVTSKSILTLALESGHVPDSQQ